METTSLDYTLFKTVVAAGSLKVYWMTRSSGGYSLYANTDRFFLFTAALGSDATDFEQNLKVPANEVSSLDDVKVKGMLDQGVPSAPPSGNVGQAIPPSATMLGGKDPDGKVKMAELDANGNLKTTGTFSGTVVVTPVYAQNKSSEFNIVNRTETTVAALSYTVPADKNFYLTLFSATSVNNPQDIAIRLKVNETVFESLNLNQQRPSNQISNPTPVKIATAGQRVTVTYDSGLARGSAMVSYQGVEAA